MGCPSFPFSGPKDTELLEGENDLVFPFLLSSAFPRITFPSLGLGADREPFQQQSLQGAKDSLNLEFFPTLW